MKPSWVLIAAVTAAGCASRPGFEPYEDPYGESLIFKASAAEQRSDWWLMGIGGALAAGAVVLLSGESADAPVVPLTPPGDAPPDPAALPPEDRDRGRGHGDDDDDDGGHGNGHGRGKDKDKDKG